ncbi:15058_t:CDS:2, partial [Dentiscutata heterogama]
MTALEWTTKSKLIVKSPISSYGVGDEPAPTAYKFSTDNISYPSYDFMMGVTTTTQTGYGFIDKMIVDHDNGGIFMNQMERNLVGQLKVYGYNRMSAPLGYNGQMMVLTSKSIRYSQNKQVTVIQRMNMTANENLLESPIYNVTYFDPRIVSMYLPTNSTIEGELLCMGYGELAQIAGQFLESQDSLKMDMNKLYTVVLVQSNSTGTINIINKNISPTLWYIENG